MQHLSTLTHVSVLYATIFVMPVYNVYKMFGSISDHIILLPELKLNHIRELR